jgi:elongation factor G
VGKPQVSYRETITGSTSENFEFSQLIGGKNQFAKVEISVESISPSKGSEFESRVSEQDFPAEFIAAAKQGILETSGCGVLSGYPLLGIKTILKSIAFREEESTEMSFKIAGSMAFKNACIKCLPALLEPIMKIEVVVPVDFMGVVINDLNSRRGKINGISSRKDIQVIDGESPLAEMFGYATMLRSITQGRASYTMQFDHYEPTNKNIQDEILRRIGRIW